MLLTQSRNPTIILVEILIFFTAAPALALAGVVEPGVRWWVSGTVIALMTGRMIREQWTWRHLGWCWHKWGATITSHLVLASLSIGVLYAVAYCYQAQMSFQSLTWSMILLSFILSFAQELVFRVFFVERLERLGFQSGWIIFWSAITFAALHAFFDRYLWTYMGLSFIFSVIMTRLYMQYRNLCLATLCHFVVNLATLYLKMV